MTIADFVKRLIEQAYLPTTRIETNVTADGKDTTITVENDGENIHVTIAPEGEPAVTKTTPLPNL